MKQIPVGVWAFVAILVVFLLLLCVATVLGAIRVARRHQVAQWSPARMLALTACAIVPWLVVWLTDLSLTVNIHGILPLLGWLLVMLLVFALLVLLPIAAIVSGTMWVAARRRR